VRKRRCAAFAFAMTFAASRAVADAVSVGPNVRVSSANPTRLHHEVTMAASPTDPNKLLACSMIFDSKDASRHVVAYSSSDGGKSWSVGLEVRRTGFVGDPTCAYGPDGAAYLSALALSSVEVPDHEMLVYRSADGGRSWSEPAVLPFIDRQWLTVDGTSGTRRGLIYLHGNAVRDSTVDADERIVFTLFRSSDGGKTFSPPKKLLPDGEHMAFGTGTGVILSDGTFLASFPEWSDRKNLQATDFRKPSGSIKVVRSKDGGETFDKADVVAEWYGCQGWTPGLPVLAVDASDGPFRDRLYITWPDRRSGRCEILFSSSKDKGLTWSPPLVINDDQSPADRERGRHHMLPAVAVNSSGVVGVSWYDRRNAAEETRQWAARFAYSLDGGETFSRSTRVSDPASSAGPSGYLPIMAHSTGGGQRRPRVRGGNLRMEIGPQWIDYLCAADTAGMAVGADGTFHTLWVDHRTGIPQLWTSAVRVNGVAVVNGSPELAALADLTQSVSVTFANTDYDPKERVISLDVTVLNTSKKTILAPLRLRVISLQSSSAVPEILGADNGMTTAGAVWDFSRDIPGGSLGPGQSGEPHRIRFRLNELGAFRLDPRGGLGSLLSVETKALGKEEEKK
jgi:hypothetical protein